MNIHTDKPTFLLILTAPRSLSTVFLRTFLEHPSVAVVNDIFSELFVKGSDETSLPAIEMELDDHIKQGKTVVVKDHAFIIEKSFSAAIRSWISKYNMRILYLVRHPKARHASFEKAFICERATRNVMSEESCDELLYTQVYKPLWDMYEEFGGEVVIAEYLQADPEKVMRRAFAYAGLDFQSQYLQYKKLADTGIPPDWQYFQHWYTECFNSTAIRRGVTDLSSIVIESERGKSLVAESEQYYTKFKMLGNTDI